ncbi:MAG: hypothetical protein FWC67_02075 [Defluviitaleaceae bacterium]|nr:hypothetical protein [Defluviitaleaceae bacterium]
MKKFVLPVLLLVMGLVLLTACGGGSRRQDVESDNPLIGTWSWNWDDSWRYVFNADGYGTRGVSGTPGFERFEWWTEGNDLLRLNMTSGHIFDNRNYRNDYRFTFTINGDELTLDNRDLDERFTYIRVN